MNTHFSAINFVHSPAMMSSGGGAVACTIGMNGKRSGTSCGAPGR